MSRVIFEIEREDGELFIIDDTEWRIPNDGLSGWHSTTTNVSMFENTTTDGSIITQQRVPAVERTISVEARDSSANEYLRTVAERFFVPHKAYSVHVTYMGRVRKFDGIQAAFTLSEGNIHQPVTFAWTITCPSPYSSDESVSVGESPYSQIAHGSGMPYRVFKKAHDGYHAGFVTGVLKSAPEAGYGMSEEDIIMLTNNGDVGSRPVFYVETPKRFGGAESFNGCFMDVDIHEVEDTGGTYSHTLRRLVISRIDWSFGGEDPSEEFTRGGKDYLRIDLSARPFRVESIYLNDDGVAENPERLRFDMVFDSLIRNPYVEQGETVFEVKVKMTDKNGIVLPLENAPAIHKYATIENLYTGV